MKSINTTELLRLIESNTLIDVRTPLEFATGHIPGALNIPLFSNEERVEVGTLYKQKGRKFALLRALEVVGPKLADFVKQASKLNYNEHLIVHCWRGGMRSSTFSWLLNTADLHAVTFEGGYKSFRNHILSFFEQPICIRILTGCTGCGKSELLRYLKHQGQQVVDLELLASHKGSAFGALGQNTQPTSEQFQNDLFWAMKDLDLTKPVWMEDESMSIGRVFIPESLWRNMRNSPLYKIEISIDERVNRLVNEYSHFEKPILASSIAKISKRLGGPNAKLALDELDKNNFGEVTKILLTYYDKAYNKTIDERKYLIKFEKHYSVFDPALIASDIIHD